MFNYLFSKIVLFINVEKYCRAGQAKYDNMAHAHCTLGPMVTNTHSQHLALRAFPLQKWLHERASKLRYKYAACLGSP